MEFRILGSLDVVDDHGDTVDVGGAQPRTVLAVLLAAGGGVVSTDAIIDAVWGESPPASAGATLQTYLSRLRRSLEPERRPREVGRVLVSEPQGYRLALDDDAVDADRFERLAEDGRTALAEGRPDEAVDAWRRAAALWRGPAFAEHRDAPFARGVVARLEERRIAMLEQRLETELALGRAAEVAAEAAGAVRVHPLRERLWASLALACYRTGRQADALRALAEARRVLVDELGVDPGRQLEELEAAVLAHDPRLDPPRRSDPATSAAAVSAPRFDAWSGTPPLVGREAELATLRAALDEAQREPRFVVIEGEPGIGKTRLLDAVGIDAAGRGAVVVWGRTHESGAAPAFWPWLQVFRSLVGVDASVGERLAAVLEPTDADATLVDTGPATFRLYESVVDAISVVAASRPLIVLLDDLQWADPASLDLLAFLASRLDDTPVLFGATLRGADADRNEAITAALSALARRVGTRRLVLDGLDEDAAAVLLRQEVGRTVDPAVATAIHARSGGNPFFLGELTRLLASEDLLDDPGAVTAAGVPVGVRDVVRRRLDRLPGRTIDVLRVAAVLGRDLDLPLLSAAATIPIDACIDVLEPATRERLLVDSRSGEASLQFAHALVREVLVADMSSLRRARVHLQAADSILELAGDDDDVAELVAEHLWAAVPLGVAERAAGALERAADVAVRRAGFATGEDLLRRAVSLRRAAGSDDRHAAAELAALVRLASVARGLHGYRAILGLVDRGRELAHRLGAQDLVVNLDWAEWAAYDTACEFDRADPLAERFLALTETSGPDDDVARMLGHGVWGIHCWHHGRIAEAADALDAGRLAAAAVPAEAHLVDIVSEQRLLGETFAVHVHDLRGDVDDPAAGYAELIRSQDDRFARAMIAGFEAAAATAVGDDERAARASRAGLAADPDMAFSFWGSMNQMYLATTRLAEGDDVEEAIALFEQGHDRFVAAGSRTGLGLCFSTMAMRLVARDAPEMARHYLDLARQELATYGETWPEPVLRIAEAEMAAREPHRAAEVAALLDRAAELAEQQGAGAIERRIAAARRRLLPV